MKKYKFILTLPYEIEIDSEEEIEGRMAWPNWSQADPVFYYGIFDTYEEAERYASNFSVYKYIIPSMYYDSWESEDTEPRYFTSIFDAEDAACRDLDIEPGDQLTCPPDEYRVEEVVNEDNEKGYKYCYYYEGKLVFDSYEDNEEFFETYEEAEECANDWMEDFEVEIGPAYELEEIEIVGIRIEEIEVEE